MTLTEAYRISLLFPLLSVFLIIVPVFGLIWLVSLIYWLPAYAVFSLLAFFWVDGRSDRVLKLGALVAPWLIAALVGGWVFLLGQIRGDAARYASLIPGLARSAVVAGYVWMAAAMVFVAMKGRRAGAKRA
jgi:hypothetical protein